MVAVTGEEQLHLIYPFTPPTLYITFQISISLMPTQQFKVYHPVVFVCFMSSSQCRHSTANFQTCVDNSISCCNLVSFIILAVTLEVIGHQQDLGKFQKQTTQHCTLYAHVSSCLYSVHSTKELSFSKRQQICTTLMLKIHQKVISQIKIHVFKLVLKCRFMLVLCWGFNINVTYEFL